MWRSLKNFIILLILSVFIFFINKKTTMQKNSKKIIQKFQSEFQGEGAGARVKRLIGSNKLRSLDPFLMLGNNLIII